MGAQGNRYPTPFSNRGLTFRDFLVIKLFREEAFLEETLQLPQATGDLAFAEFGFPVFRGFRLDHRFLGGAPNTFERRLVRGIVNQDLQLLGGNKMPPQKGLHVVLRRDGLTHQCLLVHRRAAFNHEIDGMLGRRQVCFYPKTHFFLVAWKKDASGAESCLRMFQGQSDRLGKSIFPNDVDVGADALRASGAPVLLTTLEERA